MNHSADHYVFWGCMCCAFFLFGFAFGVSPKQEPAKVCAPAQAGEKLVSTSISDGNLWCNYAQGYQTGRAIKRRKA